MVDYFSWTYRDFGDFKMSSKGNWIAALWYDSKKNYQAWFDEEINDYWRDESEIVISISDDNGETWSEPRYISSNSLDTVIDPDHLLENNFAPEFEGMNPVYLSLGEELEIVSNEPGNYHARLHIAFYDDPYYLSAVVSTSGVEYGEGDLRYACLDIEFQEPFNGLNSDENELPFTRDRLTNIYPNPFNSSKSDRKSVSTISFSLIEDSNVTIDVFNCKGQRVRTVVDEFYTSGLHSVQWDGKDESSRKVGSGVYFYRLKSKNGEDVKKMVVLK